MRTIAHKLSEDFETLQILPLADFHIGDVHSDGKKIMEWIDYIKRTPNCFALINGDIFDCAIRNSIGDVYSAALNPMAQLEQGVKLFGEISERLLCCTGGNHEHRIYKDTGIDVASLMCSQLGKPEIYSPTSALLFIRFGKQSKRRDERPVAYSLYQLHGNGGGRQESSKIGRLMELASVVDADIYVHSHTHTPAIVKNSYYRVCLQNNSVQKVDRLFVNTSSTLDYAGSYGETKGLKPTSIETPMIILDGKRHHAQAIL